MGESVCVYVWVFVEIRYIAKVAKNQMIEP